MWHVCEEEFLNYRLYSPNAAFESHLSYLTVPDPHIIPVKSLPSTGGDALEPDL